MSKILTTHVGSLPRTQEVVDFIFAREKERLALIAEVLNFADVIRIELDGEIVAFLPFFDVMTLGDVVDILGGLPTDLSTELAFLTEHRSTEQPMAVNLGAADYIRLKP